MGIASAQPNKYNVHCTVLLYCSRLCRYSTEQREQRQLTLQLYRFRKVADRVCIYSG